MKQNNKALNIELFWGYYLALPQKRFYNIEINNNSEMISRKDTSKSDENDIILPNVPDNIDGKI